MNRAYPLLSEKGFGVKVLRIYSDMLEGNGFEVSSFCPGDFFVKCANKRSW